MIVSHEHKFIYVRTKKTASSTLMHSLLPHLGPNDLCFAGRDDEWAPLNWEWGLDFAHWPLSEAVKRGIINVTTLNDYFVFTVERNPWDKVRSHYKFHHADTPLKFRDYIRKGMFHSDLYLYTNAAGELLTDYIGRFESPHETEQVISNLIKQPFKFTRHNKKSPDRSHYSEHYTKDMVNAVGKVFEREIELLGYEFGQ